MILRAADLDQPLVLRPSRKRLGHKSFQEEKLKSKRVSVKNYLQRLPAQKHIKKKMCAQSKD